MTLHSRPGQQPLNTENITYAIMFWRYLRWLPFLLSSGLTAVFLTPRMVTSASGPRRPRARGGAYVRVTRRHLGSLAVLLAKLSE